MVADDNKLFAIREAIWKIGFHPEVFKKVRRDQRAKGVDISIARDLLSHAFLDSYDAALLVAGDADYIPLVEAVKRRGKVVDVMFFIDVIAPELRLAADEFYPLDSAFIDVWSRPGLPGYRP